MSSIARMDEDGGVSEMPQPTGRRNARLRQTVRDMVISLVVVLAVVAGIMLITKRPDPAAVKVVDVTQMRTAASAQAPYPVLVPAAIENLQATSVRWEPTPASGGVPVWHVGYVLHDDAYVQVNQAATTDPAFIAEQTDGGHPVQMVDLMGRPWEQRESSERRSLVQTDGNRVTIVSGTATWDELGTIAASLSAS